MKSIFIVSILIAISHQINCSSDSDDDAPRTKREYNSNPYNSNLPSSNYGNCASNYNSEFQKPKCKSPKPCLNPAALPNINDPVKTNSTWQNVPRQWYLTAMTCWGYTKFANIFLGREVRTERELKDMCFNQFFGNFGAQYISGYGRQFQQECSPNPNGGSGNYCPTIQGSGSDGTDISLQALEVDYLVLTDSSTFSLYYRCVDNHYGDFMLTTTRPFVERSIMSHQILDTVEQMGFDIDDVMFLPCYPPIYPFPFQNYIADSCPSNSNTYGYGASYSGSCSSNYNNQGSYQSPSPYPPQSQYNNHQQYY